MNDEIRVSKLIASRGVVSRRSAESLIAEGKVTVDGEVVTEQGTTVDPKRADVRVEGKKLPPAPLLVYYLLYKPKGYITGRDDPKGRKNVNQFVERLPFRVEPVGRLDYDTEGALLLTNDGNLANLLTHPSSAVPKRYLAKVFRTPDDRDMKLIEKGKVFLDDGASPKAKVRIVDATDAKNAWVEITVTEGRNRLIRRIFAQLGHPVSKLRRESFATLSIRGMERGDLRQLTEPEVKRIRDIGHGIHPGLAGHPKSRKGFAKAKPKKSRMKKRRKLR
ncbi:MAG: rRNA pseudouridine synthase [Proteobacteria bacterium]|jgi:23S rRNA pseudouridine2605 synthase|nr:rRNA pseudouridine synthase [Pseudomonadota bacterium]